MFFLLLVVLLLLLGLLLREQKRRKRRKKNGIVRCRCLGCTSKKKPLRVIGQTEAEEPTDVPKKFRIAARPWSVGAEHGNASGGGGVEENDGKQEQEEEEGASH